MGSSQIALNTFETTSRTSSVHHKNSYSRGADALSAPRSTETDHQLVEKAQKGDTRAFDLLVIKYQYKVQAVISRFIRDPAEVQDVAQEAFIKAYRALGNFRGDSQFYTWIYRIAVNTAKNFLVSRNRRPPQDDIEVSDAEHLAGNESLQDVATPENELFRDELEKIVFETMNALPEDLRTALSLREMDGLSYEEIADIMACPVGTVRSRIFRAREAINEKVLPLMRT